MGTFPGIKRAIGRSANRNTVIALLLLLSLLVPAAQGVTHTTRLRRKSVSRHSRYVKWNPVFPGSHDLLVQQNVELDKLQLPLMYNEYELVSYELSHDLVPVSETDALKIAPDLLETHRYCRPWTRDFLEDFSAAFYDQFKVPIQVNSLVRTAQQQRQLRRHNRFAAPEAGETASTHLAGVTVDLSRRGLTKEQYRWIRDYLTPLQAAGMINPIEERQPVLHVVVFEKYSGRNQAAPNWSEANEPTEADFGSSQP